MRCHWGIPAWISDREVMCVCVRGVEGWRCNQWFKRFSVTPTHTHIHYSLVAPYEIQNSSEHTHTRMSTCQAPISSRLTVEVSEVCDKTQMAL